MIFPSDDQLFHVFLKEFLHLIKGDHIEVVIKIRVHCSGDDKKFLVDGVFAVPDHCVKGVFPKVEAVRLLAVHHKYSAADLVAVFQDRLVHKGHLADRIPTLIGVQRPRMICSAFIIFTVIFDIEGDILLYSSVLAALSAFFVSYLTSSESAASK